MAEELTKQNDWLVSTLNQPDFGLKDFVDVGLTVDNTEFKDKDFYKSKQYFQDKFKTEDGKFDEDGFDKFYEVSAEAFKVFKTVDNTTKFLDDLEYSYNNLGAPKDARRLSNQFELRKIANPGLSKIGTENIGVSHSNNMTYFELAQANKLRDADGKIMDVTGNDLGALGTIFNTDSYVMDSWEEDGFHINSDGRKVKHVKGDVKFDEDGSPYLRALKDDEDVSRHRILNWTDVVTKDGSYWNKWDIFDNDGKEQNITKSIMRAGLKIAPLMIPGVGGIYAGVTAGISLAQSLPSVIKAIDGIFNKGENQERSNTWKAFNAVQGFGNRFKGSTSEYAMENAFAFENFATMLSDIPLQLSQQKLIAELPGMLKLNKLYMDEAKYNNKLMTSLTNQIMKHPERSMNIMKNMSLAEVAAIRKIDMDRYQGLVRGLSSSYMAITSIGDAWASALEDGHDERTAGIITMGTLAGLYGLMRYTDVGNWALKGIGIDDARAGLKGAVKSELSELGEVFAKSMNRNGAGTISPAEKTLFNKIKGRVSDFVENLKNGPDTFKAKLLTGAGAEAIEEMSEEAITDSMNVLANIGMFGKTEGKHNFSAKDLFTRYTMSAIGGAAGGAIHVGIEGWKNRNDEVHKSLDKDTREKLEYMTYKYGSEAVKQEIEKQYKNGTIPADRTLSVSEYRKNEEGENIHALAKNEQDTAAWHTKEVLKNLVDSYAHILRGFTENDFDTDIQKAVFGQQRYDNLVELGSLTSVKEDYMKVVSEYIDSRFEAFGIEEGKQTNEQKSRLTESASELEKFLEGEYFKDYAEMGNFIIDEELSKAFISSNINQFSLLKYDKPYEQLNDVQKTKLEEDYETYSKSSRSFQAKQAFKMFKEINDKYSKNIGKRFQSYGELRKIAEEEFMDFDSLLNDLKFAEENLKKLESLKKNGIFEPLKIKEEGLKIDEVLTKIDEKLNMFATTGIDSYVGSVLLDKLNIMKSGLKMDHSKFSQNDLFNVLNTSVMLPNSIKNIFDLDPSTYSQSELNANIDKLTTEDPNSDFYINPDSLGKVLINPNIATDDDVINDLGGLGVDTSDPDSTYLDFKNKDQFDYFKELLKMFSSNEVESYFKSNGAITTVETINNLEGRLQNMTVNPIYEMLDDLGKTSIINYTSAIEILKEEDKRLKDARKITDYVLDNDNRITELNQIKQNISVIRALTDAAKTYEYDSDKFGYNHFNNEIRQAYASKSNNPLSPTTTANLLEVISNEDAHKIKRDLDILDNKIDYLLELSKYNSGDKLRTHKKTAMKIQALQHKKIKEFIDKISGDSNIPEDFKREITKGMDQVTMGEYYYYLNGDSVNILDTFDANDEKTMSEFESAMSSFENKLYDNFQNWISGKSSVDYTELVKILSNSIVTDTSTILHEKTTEIKETADEITEYDSLVYMLTTFSLRSSDFKHVLYDILEKGEYDYAPVYGQEFPARIAIASIINPDLFNGLLEYTASFEDTDKLGYEVLKFKNLSYVSGYHGSGKTSATLGLIDAFLKRMGYTTTATSIEQTQTDNIKKSINASIAYTKNELLEKIDGLNLDSLLVSGTNNLILDQAKVDERLNKLVAVNGVDPVGFIGDVIYIDEVTNYTAFQLSYVTQFAVKTGRKIVAFGDKLQEGAFYNNINNDIERGVKIQTPTLEFSMRANNIHVKDNNNMVRSITGIINHRNFYNPNESEETDRLYTQTINSMEFSYHDSPNVLTGNKIQSTISESDVIGLVEKTKTGILGYIYDNVDSPTYKLMKKLNEGILKDKIKMIKRSDVQGLEMDHFVIDVDLSYKKGQYLAHSRLINTLFSRSKQGSIILKNGSDFKSVDKGYTRDTEIPKEERDAFKEYRKNTLEKVLADNPADKSFLAKSKLNSKLNEAKENLSIDNSSPLQPDQNNFLQELILNENGEQVETKYEGEPKTYMSYQTFSVLGGNIEKDNGVNIVKSGQVRKVRDITDTSGKIKEYVRDLQGFLSDTAVLDDNAELEKAQGALNVLRRTLLATGKWSDVPDSVKNQIWGISKIEPDLFINDLNKAYNWRNGKFKLVISKESPSIKRYQKQGSTKVNNVIAQIVFEVPSSKGGPYLELTLADLHNDTITKDFGSYISKINTSGDVNNVFTKYLTDFPNKIKQHGTSTRFHKVKNYKKTLRDLERNSDGYIVSAPKIITSVPMGTDVIGNDHMPINPKDVGRPRIFICTEPNQKFPNGDLITPDNIDQYYANFRKQEYKNKKTGSNDSEYKDIVQWYHLNSNIAVPKGYVGKGGQFRAYMDKYMSMFNDINSDDTLNIREIDTFNDPYNAARMLFSIYSAYGAYKASTSDPDFKGKRNTETFKILSQTVNSMSLFLRIHPIYDESTGELLGVESKINDWEGFASDSNKPLEINKIEFAKLGTNPDGSIEHKTQALKNLFKTNNNRGLFSIMHMFGDLFGSSLVKTGIPSGLEFSNIPAAYQLFDTMFRGNSIKYNKETKKIDEIANSAVFPHGIFLHPNMAKKGSNKDNFVQNMFITDEMKDLFYIDVMPRGQAYILDLNDIVAKEESSTDGSDGDGKTETPAEKLIRENKELMKTVLNNTNEPLKSEMSKLFSSYDGVKTVDEVIKDFNKANKYLLSDGKLFVKIEKNGNKIDGIYMNPLNNFRYKDLSESTPITKVLKIENNTVVYIQGAYEINYDISFNIAHISEIKTSEKTEEDHPQIKAIQRIIENVEKENIGLTAFIDNLKKIQNLIKTDPDKAIIELNLLNDRVFENDDNTNIFYKGSNLNNLIASVYPAIANRIKDLKIKSYSVDGSIISISKGDYEIRWDTSNNSLSIIAEDLDIEVFDYMPDLKMAEIVGSIQNFLVPLFNEENKDNALKILQEIFNNSESINTGIKPDSLQKLLSYVKVDSLADFNDTLYNIIKTNYC